MTAALTTSPHASSMRCRLFIRCAQIRSAFSSVSADANVIHGPNAVLQSRCSACAAVPPCVKQTMISLGVVTSCIDIFRRLPRGFLLWQMPHTALPSCKVKCLGFVRPPQVQQTRQLISRVSFFDFSIPGAYIREGCERRIEEEDLDFHSQLTCYRMNRNSNIFGGSTKWHHRNVDTAGPRPSILRPTLTKVFPCSISAAADAERWLESSTKLAHSHDAIGPKTKQPFAIALKSASPTPLLVFGRSGGTQRRELLCAPSRS